MQSLLPALLVELERRATEAEAILGAAPVEFAGQVALRSARMSQARVEMAQQRAQLASGGGVQATAQRVVLWAQPLEGVERELLPAILRFDRSDSRATGLLRASLPLINWQEIEPVVVCSSTAGHATFSRPAIIFLPVGEEERLLRSPDLFHELGHCLFERRRTDLLGTNWDGFVAAYVTSLDVGLVSAAVQSKLLSTWIGDFWSEEYACDVFATYVCGATFGLQHVALALAKGLDPWTDVETHPPDEARCRAVVRTLRHIGDSDGANEIDRLWQQVLTISAALKPPGYDLENPDALLHELVDRVVTGCRALGLRSFDPTSTQSMYLPKLIERAWQEAAAAPNGFHSWEAAELGALFGQLGL